jgi:hypothetical protein
MVPSRQMKLGLGQVSSQRYGPKLRPSYAYYFEWSGIERMGKFELEHSLQNLPTAKWEWKVAPVWRSSMNEDLRRGIISRSKFRYSHANLRSCWNVRLEQLFILILRSASSGASALVQTCPSALFRSIRSNRHSLAVVSDHSVGSIPVQAQVSFAETVPFIRYHFTGYHFIKRRYFLLDF